MPLDHWPFNMYASTWARTRDLSVNSRALCQLSHGGNTMDTEAKTCTLQDSNLRPQMRTTT